MTDLTQIETAAAGTVALVAIPAVAVIAILLIIPVVMGVRRRRRPPPPPQHVPRTPTSDLDTTEREPAEMPQDGRRRTAHELPGYGNLGSRPRRDGGPDDDRPGR